MKINKTTAVIPLIIVLITLCACAVSDYSDQFDITDTNTWFDTTLEPISAEDAEKVVPGMTLEEVVDEIGKPYRDVGSGKIILEWKTTASDNLLVVFEKEFVEGNTEITQYKVVKIINSI